MFRRSEPHGVPERHPVIQILPKWGVAMMVCGAICSRGCLFWLTPRRFLPGGSAWQVGKVAVGPRSPAALPYSSGGGRTNAVVAFAPSRKTPPTKEATDGSEVKVELDLPPGVELLGYERSGDGHGFEVKFPLPDSCRCEKCGHEEPSTYEYKNTVYVVRDLDLWGQPSFLIFQPCFHRCSRCGHRQEHFAPFKRKKVMYTYRFEEYVLRMLIGSNEEEVAARLGISAETVELIVENQLKDDKRIDPARVIKHVGMDEISLKKRHKLYVTLMTDLTDPESPKVLAVARGRDTAAALQCLGKLTPEQRAAVETHRVDMGKVYGPVCNEQLPNSRLVVDRFHVAKQFNEVVDDLRKKNHTEVQGPIVEGRAEAVPLADVGVPPRPEGPEARGTRGVGSAVRRVARVEGRV